MLHFEARDTPRRLFYFRGRARGFEVGHVTPPLHVALDANSLPQ
jgi:hypothetical protein